MTSARAIRVLLQPPFAAPEGQGLLAPDARVRTLRKVLVTYPEVRHVVPDTIRLDAGADARTVETVVRFLERQQWLVKTVIIE